MTDVAPTLLAPGLTDDQRRRDLRRMKTWPLLLLVLAGLLFIIGWWQAAQPDASWIWGYVRAAGEAGLVGGLADWFAVTALFRHPLGIPIPHTALIPTKKDQLGDSLGAFVRTNFLNPEAVRTRLADANPARMLGTYVSDQQHRARLVAEAASLATTAVESVSDADAQLLVRNLVFQQAAAYAWGPPAGKVLEAVVTDHGHDAAVDVLFRAAHDWARDNEADLIDLVADRGPGQGFFLARAAHEAVGRRAYSELMRWLTECMNDRNCPTRRTLDAWLISTATRLREDPELITRVELFKQKLLVSPEAHEAIGSLWPSFKRVALEALADPDSDVRLRADDYLAALGDRLVTDPEFQDLTNRRIADAVGYLVERYGDEAALLISETVARWDATEASRRIELQVGRDLQFIRINGTVVGALAGVAIHTIGLLVIG